MIDLLFPIYCTNCGKESREPLCLDCWKILKKYSIIKQQNRCERCSHLLKNDTCLFCNSRHLFFDKLIALYEYNSFTRQLLIDWKYNNNANVYRIFIKDVLKIVQSIQPDRIGYISSSKFGKKYRSYDVLEKLVKEIRKITQIPYGKDIRKIKKNKQSKGKQAERFFNVLFSLGLTIEFHTINKYLLIEDTTTTGATVNESARLLKEAGVKEVIVLSIFLEDFEEESLWSQ